MSISRRQFLHLMGLAGAAGMLPKAGYAALKQPSDLYEIPKFGNTTLMHFTDCHAQLMPVYFREPSVNIGVAGANGKAPHLVGKSLMSQFNIDNPLEEYAFTYLDFDKAAKKYGKVGGFAHMQTLINKIRASRGPGNSLLLDGGDTWQGSATSTYTRGADMVGATNLLGVDVMTGHWEFTYQDKEIIKNLGDFNGDFIAQNVNVSEEALFDYKFADFDGFDEDEGRAFKPYIFKKVGGVTVAIIGQAFPYTPIANPRRFIPDWTFGINEESMQDVVDEVRAKKPDVVILLSHNGMDVDLKMASRVRGIDAIFGGHTHDGVPGAIPIKNPGGVTLVTNAGSNGKFLGVMDLDVRGRKVRDFRYRLVPIFSNLLPADKKMQAYINKVRKPYDEQLSEVLATADTTMYRRGNFNGTFDQIICDALIQEHDAQIALSPGFRWGTTVPAGHEITMENVMDQTGMTYPETYRNPNMTGKDIKLILEDVADNLFNVDPYYQQGGDMVRLGGMNYVCDPLGKSGKRISDMTLDDGTKIDPKKKYVVTGWATVNSKAAGRPVWDVVADYLRREKVARIRHLNTPKLKNVKGNKGLPT